MEIRGFVFGQGILVSKKIRYGHRNVSCGYLVSRNGVLVEAGKLNGNDISITDYVSFIYFVLKLYKKTKGLWSLSAISFLRITGSRVLLLIYVF